MHTDASVENLSDILSEITTTEWPVLMVGPAPIADKAHNARTRALDARFAAVCADHDMPYVEVFRLLDDDRVWRAQAQAGDGSHPAREGYDRLADIVFEPWYAWLSR